MLSQVKSTAGLGEVPRIKIALLKGANTGLVADSAECKHFD